MVTTAIVIIGLVQVLSLAGLWLRVTTRDRQVSQLRRMRTSLDWRGAGHRSRVAAGLPRLGKAPAR
mgnify:CR=1 FL=1